METPPPTLMASRAFPTHVVLTIRPLECPHLQEARDVPLVANLHGYHILKHPEEGPVVTLLGS